MILISALMLLYFLFRPKFAKSISSKNEIKKELKASRGINGISSVVIDNSEDIDNKNDYFSENDSFDLGLNLQKEDQFNDEDEYGNNYIDEIDSDYNASDSQEDPDITTQDATLLNGYEIPLSLDIGDEYFEEDYVEDNPNTFSSDESVVSLQEPIDREQDDTNHDTSVHAKESKYDLSLFSDDDYKQPRTPEPIKTSNTSEKKKHRYSNKPSVAFSFYRGKHFAPEEKKKKKKRSTFEWKD